MRLLIFILESLASAQAKAAKKNQKRAEKRAKERAQKLKEDGVIDRLIHETDDPEEKVKVQDPVEKLKEQLQQAKDNKVWHICTLAKSKLTMTKVLKPHNFFQSLFASFLSS